MPIGPTKTKAQKQKVVRTEMLKFKHGTLHSGSKHGPVVENRKQAVAIAMKESGQSKYDRSGHQPGNPGFKREGKAPYREYNGGAHAKQPHGHSIGNASEFVKHTPNQSFQSEQREHGGNTEKESSMGKGHREVAHTGPHDRGSKLIEQDNDSQRHEPHNIKHGGLHGDGVDVAAHHRGGTHGGMAHSFKPPAANMAHGYGHSITERKGPHRLSGHKGAHMIGCKK